jgi:hypothetical protein
MGALLVHDKRIDTFSIVLERAKQLPIDLKTFCFSDQKVSQSCDYIFDRPIPDKKQIKCSYLNLATGMKETELMQLSWLRNKALDIALNYDAIIFIDSDVLIPLNAIPRLLKIEGDAILGWYFHKRLDAFPISYEGGLKDEDIINKKVMNCFYGGNGCLLLKKNIIKNIRYNLYNGIDAEDTIFLQKITDAGFKIKVDLGLFCEHLGNDWTHKALEFKNVKFKLWKLE